MYTCYLCSDTPGYNSPSRREFRRHLIRRHGADFAPPQQGVASMKIDLLSDADRRVKEATLLRQQRQTSYKKSMNRAASIGQSALTTERSKVVTSPIAESSAPSTGTIADVNCRGWPPAPVFWSPRCRPIIRIWYRRTSRRQEP